jgi:hypothetical protein
MTSDLFFPLIAPRSRAALRAGIRPAPGRYQRPATPPQAQPAHGCWLGHREDTRVGRQSFSQGLQAAQHGWHPETGNVHLTIGAGSQPGETSATRAGSTPARTHDDGPARSIDTELDPDRRCWLSITVEVHEGSPSPANGSSPIGRRTLAMTCQCRLGRQGAPAQMPATHGPSGHSRHKTSTRRTRFLEACAGRACSRLRSRSKTLAPTGLWPPTPHGRDAEIV